ncbi:unnamed protein product [Arabis nemorensis]|uniref:Uncharacterized protein n=1 Tax=Arabis nemorensis TaxID=586526 RepID=A0A565BB43_9BRAS|nr:unnamed protein product [Arabis nemorensis]
MAIPDLVEPETRPVDPTILLQTWVVDPEIRVRDNPEKMAETSIAASPSAAGKRE